MYHKILLTLLIVSFYSVAGVFHLDTTHSNVGFRVGYMMVSKISGQFSDFSGQIITSENNQITDISGTVKIKSLTTLNEKRDRHLKGPDFFHESLYPTITFVSNRVEHTDSSSIVVGQLTIHGITRTVSFPIKVSNIVTNSNHDDRIGVSGQFDINRKKFGINYSKKMDNGGLIVDDIVTIQLDIQATRG